MPLCPPNEADRITRTEIRVAMQAVYCSLYHTPSRRTGRRIVARDAAFGVLFDTGNCYDFANATNAVEVWRREMESSLLAECAHCGAEIGGSDQRAQDATTGGSICMRCIQKAIAPELADGPLLIGEQADEVEPCPF